MKNILKYLLIIAIMISFVGCSRSGSSRAMRLAIGLNATVKRATNKNFRVIFFSGFDTESIQKMYLVLKPNTYGEYRMPLEEARRSIVNISLDILNYLNTSKTASQYNRGSIFPVDQLELIVNYAAEKDSEREPKCKDEVSLISFGESGNIFYFEKHDSKEPFYMETMSTAFEIVIKNNEIKHPKYLKWLDKVPKGSKTFSKFSMYSSNVSP